MDTRTSRQRLTSALMLFAVVATIVFLIALARPAFAQQAPAALPTAPGADRARNGGYAQAPASLPGTGGSVLEPWLVTWLLPVGGILTVVAALAVDKRIRRTGA